MEIFVENPKAKEKSILGIIHGFGFSKVSNKKTTTAIAAKSISNLLEPIPCSCRSFISIVAIGYTHILMRATVCRAPA